jgi:hypothetical protein
MPQGRLACPREKKGGLSIDIDIYIYIYVLDGSEEVWEIGGQETPSGDIAL